jgi:hypothetical protein
LKICLGVCIAARKQSAKTTVGKLSKTVTGAVNELSDVFEREDEI